MNIKTQNILLVTSEFPPQPGGIGNHALNLAEFLSKDGFEVQVITDQRESGKEEIQFDSNLKFSVKRVALRSFRPLMYLKRIHEVFRFSNKANVIIATGKFPLWNVALLSFFRRKKYVAIVHGTEVNYKNNILRWSINSALKRFHKIIAVSKFTKSLIAHLNLNNIVVIPNGFNAAAWSSKEGEQLNLKGSPKLITVGNVTSRKGQLNVIKHLPSVIKSYPDVHYHCVGYPTEKNEFLKEAQNLKVVDRITFHGRVQHEQLPLFLKNSDIFIMLSSQTATGDVEGFGIAILEANHAGLPAIGAIGCGIEDAIDNVRSGILIDHEDDQQFVEAIRIILDKREEFSKRAKEWAAEHSWEKVIKLYIKEIRTL